MATSVDATVYVVDDDQAVRESLAWLVESIGMRVKAFASAAEFLAAWTPAMPGCLVLDNCMEGMSGLELQRQLRRDGADIPIIMVTGFATVQQAVDSLKGGAVDFLRKPYDNDELMDRIRTALARDATQRTLRTARDSARARIQVLTAREREVMQLVTDGYSSRQIAGRFNLSIKTVEAHRSNLSRKLGIDSVADLVRLVITAADVPTTDGSDGAPRS